MLGLVGCAKHTYEPQSVLYQPWTAEHPPPSVGRLEIMLFPRPGPKPVLHVALSGEGKPVRTLRLARGTLHQLSVTDSFQAMEKHMESVRAMAVDEDGGVTVTLERPTRGAWGISYDLEATSDPRAPASSIVVADDRFRALGEQVVLLPDAFDTTERSALTILFDGAALHAPNAASSFGLGQVRKREASARALVHAAYIAGSLGSASFTEALDVDHAAWLGYTAFDPRPAVAEVAQIRTALREQWRGGGEEEHTLLFVSTARPAGSYALVPRAGSLVVHLGPSEPWSAAMRVAITQHLMHAWIGGELHLPGGAETTWFHQGFARYLGARLLEQLGFLKPQDAQDYTSGLLATQATSPLRGQSLAALAAADTPVARATMTARGALYAQRLEGRLRAQGKNALESALFLPMMQAAREKKLPTFTAAMLESSLEAVLPDAKHDRDLLDSGADLTLPPNALGPCFRVNDGEYRTFELGFDLAATLDSDAHAVVGVSGAAADAGLVNGDILDDASYREGHPEIAAKIAVLRGGKKVILTYPPGGARKKGQVVERIRSIPDAQCGAVL